MGNSNFFSQTFTNIHQYIAVVH